LFTWAVVGVVPMGATLSGPDMSPGAPGEVRLEAASFEAAGTGAELVPLAVGLSAHLAFLVRRGDCPSVRQQWRPP
jgi:hypothetical protein